MVMGFVHFNETRSYCYFALVTDELLAGNLGKRKLKIRITRTICVVNFYILDYKTYINIRSSQVFKMIRDARLKKDTMSYNQNLILKKIFLSCKLE